MIEDQAILQFQRGKKVLRLTERTDLLQLLESLPPNSPRIRLATGKLIGEGFDHAPLETVRHLESLLVELQEQLAMLWHEYALASDAEVLIARCTCATVETSFVGQVRQRVCHTGAPHLCSQIT